MPVPSAIHAARHSGHLGIRNRMMPGNNIRTGTSFLPATRRSVPAGVCFPPASR
ncbi:hypothetical protein [Chitinophaga sp.]|uniref:hypothetical protein n=1 Tax=Chitinophaga sp. TaxID=1869181 RepID=UPI0031D53E84